MDNKINFNKIEDDKFEKFKDSEDYEEFLNLVNDKIYNS